MYRVRPVWSPWSGRVLLTAVGASGREADAAQDDREPDPLQGRGLLAEYGPRPQHRYGRSQVEQSAGRGTTTSTLLYLTAPVTMLWAWSIFGQQPSTLQWIGLAVVLSGVGLAARRTNRREQDTA